MSTPAYLVIERLTRVAPFGIGLWDAASGRLVSDGINVRVFRESGTRLVNPVPATASRTGVFVPHALFGGEGIDDRDAAASPPAPFVIEVRDTRDRYSSCVIRAGERNREGFVLPPCLAALEVSGPAAASPSPPPRFVPLFRTAAHTASGLAVVRASLTDANTGTPAEFAVLEVRESNRLLGRGIADGRGEVAAFFAYPEPIAHPVWSPPHAPPAEQRLVDQRWKVDVSIRYRRGLRRFATEPARPGRVPDPTRPPLADLCDILQQPIAHVTTTSPPMTVGEQDLRYGEELVLAELLIDPV